MPGDTVNVELFKVASTLFLGIGLAAAFQQLLPFDHAEASRRGRLRWAFWDDLIAALMLVLIAAGEVMSIRVITADDVDLQARLASDAQPWVVRLLVITAGYIVVKFFASRVLQVTWRREQPGTSARCTYKESVRMVGAALSGLGLGGMLLAHFAEPSPNLLFVSPYRSLWPVWLIATGLLIAGLIALGRSHFMREPFSDDSGGVPSHRTTGRRHDRTAPDAAIVRASRGAPRHWVSSSRWRLGDQPGRSADAAAQDLAARRARGEPGATRLRPRRRRRRGH